RNSTTKNQKNSDSHVQRFLTGTMAIPPTRLSPSEPRNWFYLFLNLSSVVFIITALAYALVPVLEQKAMEAGQPPPPSPFRDALRTLEAEHSELATPDSPTQRVGGQPIEGFRTVTHREPMLSIDNTYNPDQLREWDKSIRKLLGGEAVTYVVELKIDGVAISLTYENGRLAVGATRGDGLRGDDVTHNLRTIRELPLTLRADRPPPLFEARGEVYMTRAELVRINRERAAAGEEPYANPRNFSAG